MEIPVGNEYFEHCVKGAEAAGLRFLGRAVIDSGTSTLRRQVTIRKTGIPVTAFMRSTSLFFVLPGQALLVCATFKEEITHDYPAAGRGERVPCPRHPYWKLHIFLGAHPGTCSEDNSGWVSLPQSFEGGHLPIHVQDHPEKYRGSRFNAGSRGPADRDPEVHDSQYSVLLGYYPVEATPGLFRRAMASMAQALQPHARPGPLGQRAGQSGVFSLPPWQDFTGCEDWFWEQFPYAVLNEFFSAPLQRDPKDAELHDLVSS